MLDNYNKYMDYFISYCNLLKVNMMVLIRKQWKELSDWNTTFSVYDVAQRYTFLALFENQKEENHKN